MVELPLLIVGICRAKPVNLTRKYFKTEDARIEGVIDISIDNYSTPKMGAIGAILTTVPVRRGVPWEKLTIKVQW